MTEVLSLYRGVINIPDRKSWRQIAAEVADEHGITLERMLSRSQARDVAWPRQEAMARIYATGRYSLPQIGKWFDRDHSTVHWACQRVAKRAQQLRDTEARYG